MYGAIIGDFAGSIYEYDEFLDSQKKIINLERRLNALNDPIFLKDNSFFSDDTILTISILDSLLNNIDYEVNLKKYCSNFINYSPNIERYFKTAFSPNFINWSQSTKQGTSNGNGSAMRISAIANTLNNEKDIINQTLLATKCSHNHPESIKAALCVSLMIYYLKNGYDKNKTIDYICQKFKYDLSFDINKLQEENMFSSSSKDAITKSLFCLKISNNFEESIKYALSIGGDTDTIACIVGSMAEQVFSINSEYIKFVESRIPDEFNAVLKRQKKLQKQFL
ncbi:MAG: ADP-ribosylglycohydrolase family protein [bacterium]